MRTKVDKMIEKIKTKARIDWTSYTNKSCRTGTNYTSTIIGQIEANLSGVGIVQ